MNEVPPNCEKHGFRGDVYVSVWCGEAVRHLLDAMSAIFDFSSLLTVLLLFICTCAFLRSLRKTIFDDPNQEPAPAPQVMNVVDDL
jgi:hypothetical protein